MPLPCAADVTAGRNITRGMTALLPEEGQEGGEPAGGTESGNEVSQPWMSYPLDPETGYRVDPETGRFFDPQTGEPIDGGESVPDPNLPVNPNLPTTPNVQ